MNFSRRAIILPCVILTSLYCQSGLSATCLTVHECCQSICKDLTKRCISNGQTQTKNKCPTGFMVSSDGKTCVVSSARPPHPQSDDTGYYVTAYYSGTCPVSSSSTEYCQDIITVSSGDTTYPECACQDPALWD